MRPWPRVEADRGGWPEAVPLGEPGRVVGVPELDQRLAELLDGVETVNPEQVLLEGADEALGTAVALGRTHEGGRAFDAQEGEFLPEGVGHVLALMAVADGKALGDLLSKGTEAGAHALADRLQRLEGGGPARGVDADALGRAVAGQ